MDISLFQSQKLIQRQYLGMKFSMLLDSPREKYWEEIQKIEESTIFKELSSYGRYKIVKIVPLRHYFFYKGKEGKNYKKTTPSSLEEAEDMESFLEGKELIKKAKSLPVDIFYYYFIEGEGTPLEVSEATGFTPEEVKLLRELVDRALIRGEMLPEDSVSSISSSSSAEVVAKVQFSGEDIDIAYFRDRHRYSINEDALNMVMKRDDIDSKKKREIANIIKKLQVINRHLDLVYQVVNYVVQYQKKYLKSGNLEDLKPLQEKELANALGVSPSWISRIVKGRWNIRYIQVEGKYIKLRDLFLNETQIKKKKGERLIKEILSYKSNISDSELAKMLREKGFQVSRRTVNNWRREVQKKHHSAEGKFP